MSLRGLAWALAGLLGIALTAVITWEASRLASQHIGLASQPLATASQLAPPAPSSSRARTAAPHHHAASHPKRTRPRHVEAASPAASAPAAPTTSASAATSTTASHLTRRRHRARGGDRTGQQTQDRGSPSGGVSLPAGGGGAQVGSTGYSGGDGRSDDGRGGDGSSDDGSGSTGASGASAQPDD